MESFIYLFIFYFIFKMQTSNNLLKGEALMVDRTLNDNVPLFRDLFEVRMQTSRPGFIVIAFMNYFLMQLILILFNFFWS